MLSELHPSASPSSDLIYHPPSYVERLDWADVFTRSQPVEVELGSGDGSFLLQWAALHPERNFLGLERLKGRLRKLDRKGRRAGLANLCGLRLEAAYGVEYLMPPASVRAFHLYFPDPWPKRKHQRHRLVNPRFADAVARALEPGGGIYLRTDDGPYFDVMNDVFGNHDRFGAVPTPADLAAVWTDFEREFAARSIPTRRAAYQLRPG